MKSALPPILMVDDEPNMRATVSELLMDDGYTVDVAESGEQAVEMLTEPSSEYFMMITDGRLGGMSGYELLKKAKADFPRCRFHDHRFCYAKTCRGGHSERRGGLSFNRSRQRNCSTRLTGVANITISRRKTKPCGRGPGE